MMTMSKERTAMTPHERKPGKRKQALLTLATWPLFLAADAAAASPATPAPTSAAVIQDDFSDGNYSDKPSWTVDSGSFEVRNGELMFGTGKDTMIHLDLGKVAWNSPLKVKLKLRQTNASGKTSFLFGLALADTGFGRTQEISASPNPGYFGTSGFYDGATVGAQGAMLNGDTAPQTIEIAFDPVANSVIIWKDAGRTAWKCPG